MKQNASCPCTMVIFGGTGDLTHKKLMPALYRMDMDGLLGGGFEVLSVGRRDKTTAQYRQEVLESLHDSIKNVNDAIWQRFSQRVRYHRQSFEGDSGYATLNEKLDERDLLYYLAVSPDYFEMIVEKLEHHGMAHSETLWRRIVIEKPFGRDLKTAEFLHEKITRVFNEDDIYRIDHYLGKAMLQNMIVIRFANAVFESVWNQKYIDNVQISACETVGVGSRGGYYEQFGALRDMVQNHLLQMLALTAMEPPKSFGENDIREEKLKVIRHLIDDNQSPRTVRGQYGEGEVQGRRMSAYRSEERVMSTSDTETYAALQLYIDNDRWRGVPFYLRTGKRMKKRYAQVDITFKKCPHTENICHGEDFMPNRLVINIQPNEGVSFSFNALSPRTEGGIVPVKMDFCQNCDSDFGSPEAYERLLYDALRADASLFPKWEEVRLSWQFADRISRQWRNEIPKFPNYEAGTWGPIEADKMLAEDGRSWWND